MGGTLLFLSFHGIVFVFVVLFCRYTHLSHPTYRPRFQVYPLVCRPSHTCHSLIIRSRNLIISFPVTYSSFFMHTVEKVAQRPYPLSRVFADPWVFVSFLVLSLYFCVNPLIALLAQLLVYMSSSPLPLVPGFWMPNSR